MRHVRRTVEELVDTVSAVGLDDLTVPLLGDLLDGVAIIAEEGAGLDKLD